MSGEDRLSIASSCGRRRLWTSDEKQWIVAESYEEGASVAVIARQHGAQANQLCTWRREFRAMRPLCGFVISSDRMFSRAFAWTWSRHHRAGLGEGENRDGPALGLRAR